MRELHVILPMAGLGSRFANAGFTTPKPLVPVDGMPMFRKALSSLGGWGIPVTTTIVIRREHDEAHGLGRLLAEALPGCGVAVLDELTRGAVETCLAAAPRMRGDRGVLVLDCDLWFESDPYRDLVRDALGGVSTTDAGLLTFRSDDPRYSYALTEGDRVVRTAEKVVISDRAIAGAYFVAREDRFLEAARILLGRPLSETMKEYYVSFLYNVLLEQGCAVRTAEVTRYASFGTPEELRAYEVSGSR